jgi:hypothetical protein
MSEAIDALERQKQEIIDSCARRVAELDAWIAKIRAEELKTGPKVPVTVEIPVKAGQYKGMKAGAALQSYLTERGGGPVEVEKAVKDLILGGSDLGTAKDGRGFDRRPRVIRNAIRNNRIFRYADSGEKKVELANRFAKSA